MRLRIAFLTPPNSMCILNWAEKLQSRGHDILLLSEGENTTAGQLPFRQLHLAWGRSYAKFFFNRQRIEEELKAWGAHVVHAFYSTNYGLLAARQNTCPAVLTVAGSDVLLEPRRNKFFYWVNRYVFNEMTWINAVSKHLQLELQKNYGVQKNCFVFPAGVDLTRFRPNKEAAEKSLRVISTRNFSPVYNHGLLAEAIPIIYQQQKDVEFWFFGDGPLRPQFEAQLKSFPAVRFFGWQPREKIAESLRSAQVYVSTSRSDGTSASLLEAMACGLFPVVSDLPSNREWITDGENGFLVPVDKPGVLAEKIVTVLSSYKLRKLARERNRRIIQERADIVKIVSRLENLYSKAINF